MSKKRSRRSGDARAAGLRNSRIAVAIILALMCVVGVSLFAQVSSRKKGKRASGEVSVASFAPASPTKEYFYAGGRLIATEEPPPDTTPPVFPNGCPSTMNVAAAYSCPYATSAVVNYTNPTATDDNPGVTVSCNPPSGSSFAVGSTTVTCTATDTSGNTATCSFVVDLFSACLADDSIPSTVVLFNASTGEFRFCCGGVVNASGWGTLTIRGCDLTIDQIKGDRTVHISASGGAGSGNATIKHSGVVTCQITDTSMANDVCTCN